MAKKITKDKKEKVRNCCVCDKPIPKARVKALILLGKDERTWTCIKCTTDRKHKGIFMGESGTSELKICSEVYDESVRSIFSSKEKDDSNDED